MSSWGLSPTAHYGSEVRTPALPPQLHSAAPLGILLKSGRTRTGVSFTPDRLSSLRGRRTEVGGFVATTRTVLLASGAACKWLLQGVCRLTLSLGHSRPVMETPSY